MTKERARDAGAWPAAVGVGEKNHINAHTQAHSLSRTHTHTQDLKHL